MRSRRVDRGLLVLIACLAIQACGPQSVEPGNLQKDSRPDGRTSVTGFLVAVGGEVRLCGVLLESYPPQCGGEAIEVTGLDLASMSLTEAEGVIWSDDLVTIVGVLVDGVLSDARQSE